MSGKNPNPERELPSPTRVEMVERAIKGLVQLAKTRVVEEIQVNQPNLEERVEPTTIVKFYK